MFNQLNAKTMALGYRTVLVCFLMTHSAACKKPAPEGDFSIKYNGNIVPAEVVFTSVVTNATSYSWNFGDGSTSKEENPTHTYYTAGRYNVVLAVTGKGGTTTITHEVTIRKKPTGLRIVAFEVDNMPFTDGNGAGWDPGSGPDHTLRLRITPLQPFMMDQSSYYSDVKPSDLPLAWTLSTPVNVTSLSAIRAFILYDYDSLDPDDQIGGLHMDFSNYPDYPDVITVQTQGGEFKFRLGVEWY
jgi:PKD repeat protein